MNLVVVLLGWPSLVAALALSAAGVWRRQPVLVWTAVGLITPISLYLAAAPALPFAGLAPLVTLVLAAWSCRRTRRWSWLGLSAYCLMVLLLALVVFFQPTPGRHAVPGDLLVNPSVQVMHESW